MAQPGAVLLCSRILDDSAALTGPEFARWGENTCVPSVQATGGVSHTLRYESLGFMKRHRSSKGIGVLEGQLEKVSCRYDFLDIYFMPNIKFCESEEWKRLPIIGHDAEITGDLDASKLLERLLMLTEFRLHECDTVDDISLGPSTSAPAPFLVTIVTSSGEQIPHGLANAGKIVGIYEAQRTSTISAMEQLEGSSASHNRVVLIACNSLRNVSLPEPSDGWEVGVWGLRKQYTGDERSPAAWRPGVRI